MENVKKKDLLENEISSEILTLSNLTPGTEEHTAAVEAVAKLYKLNIEETENERSFQSKKEQLLEERNSRYSKIAIDAANIVLPLMFYGFWMKKGFKFEETGVFTSTTFRNLFSKFKPR